MADLVDALITLIDWRIAQSVFIPTVCYISKIYDDNYHVDVKFTNGDTYSYLPCFANNLAVDNMALFIRARSGNTQYVVISR